MIAGNIQYTVILYILYGIMYMLVPAVVLYPAVKKHCLGYRIMFYQITAVAYVTLVSFALAYLHFYNTVSTWIAFAAVPVFLRIYLSRKDLKIRLEKWRAEDKERKLYEESFKSRKRRYLQTVSKAVSFIYVTYIKGRIPQYIAAGIVIYLICSKFGYFHFTTYTYGCSDEATHVYWIKNLLNGNAFPAGLYPHGLHFMIAGFCSMFGLQPISAYLCFTPVSVTIIMLSAFVFIKRIFGSGFAAAASVILFILYEGVSNMEWYYRLGVLMPMELAMFAVFAMALGLVCWIKDGEKTSLYMIGLGIAGTTFIHVFATIIAFFIVLAFAIIFLMSMIRKRVFHKFILCGILAIVISVIPYGAGFACGYHLEQSFSWGMSVVNTSNSSTDSDSEEDTDAVSESEESSEDEETADTAASTSSISLYDYVEYFGYIMTDLLTETTEGAYLMVGCWALCFIYAVIGLLAGIRKKEIRMKYAGILFAAGAWILLFGALYLCPSLGIITIMSRIRAAVYIGLFSIVLYAAPLAILADAALKINAGVIKGDRWFTVIACAAGLAAALLWGGKLYKNLIYSFTMENMDMETEQYLLDNEEKYTWTIISTTNARLGTLYDGYHYEIMELLLAQRDRDELYIPTKDIYVVVENKVPDITAYLVDGSDFSGKLTDVSAECALNRLSDYIIVENGTVNSSLYLKYNNRLGIMSHLYYWMEELKKVYPDSISVFLQDDNCTVYHISQDPYFLLNLVVDYTEAAQEAVG